MLMYVCFFFQAEDGIRDYKVTGVQTCALPIWQQQRVAIARALVNEPDIVFADEPTGNLDSETSHEVVELMKALHAKKGLTFIVVTHDGAVGNQMQRVIVMRNGGILKSFRPTPA